MAVFLSPVGGVAAQFFTNTGAVLTGGKLYTYAAGTTTPATTFTSSSGATAQPNPVVLDAAGRVPNGGEIWLTDGISYKFVLKDSNDVLIATYDNITGINSNSVSFTNQQQIITATAGQTVFNLSISYAPGTNSLSVFVDGVNQYGSGAPYAYTETSSTSVTFTNGLHVGALVKFTTTQQQGAGAVNASQVTYNPAGTGAVATNVQAKLRESVSVFDFMTAAQVADVQARTLAVDVTAALNTAHASCLTLGKTPYYPAGSYRISSKIDVRAPFHGEEGAQTIVCPFNAAVAFDILECSTGEIRDIFVDYTNVGAANINTACIGFRLLFGATIPGRQITATRFKNLYVQRGYNCFVYNALTPTAGQLFNVFFENCYAMYCKGVGTYLNCTSSSLEVTFDTCSTQCAFADSAWNGGTWTDSTGYYFVGIPSLILRNVGVGVPRMTTLGDAFYFESCLNLITQNVHIEGGNYNTGGVNMGLVGLINVKNAILDLDFSVVTIDVGAGIIAPLVQIGAGCINIQINKIYELSPTYTSGIRKFFATQNTSDPLIRTTVLDTQIPRADCYFGVNGDLGFSCEFRSELLALQTNWTTKRQASRYTATTPGVATKILDITAFGGSAAPISGLYLVAGASSNTALGFADTVLVSATANGTQIVVATSTNNIGGYSYARTYTVTPTELRVSIPTDTAYISVTGIAQAGLT
jgi:hypothetical protein